MGQSSSRPSKVFEAVDVKVDPSLRHDLESTPETDVVRRLYTEKYIQKQVAQRLYDLEQERLANFDSQYKQQLARGGDLAGENLVGTGDGPSSADLRKQVQALHKDLSSRPLRGRLDAESSKARETLVECLVKQKSRPLDCRKAFADFQKELSRVEDELSS